MMYSTFFTIIAISIFLLLICDRINWLKKHTVFIGVLFGLPAALANILLFQISLPIVILSFVDIPVMTAGFFFGTIPGLVTALIAAASRLALQFQNPTDYWWVSCLIIITIAGFSILTRKFFFSGRRPSLISTILCMVFAECVRFFMFCLLSSDVGSDAFFLIINNKLTNYFILIVIAGAATNIAARSWGTIRSNLKDKLLLVFILFDLGCVGIFTVSSYFAEKDAAKILTASGVTLHESFLAQVRYVLRDNAATFTTLEPNLRKCNHKQLQKLAEKTEFDEINIYDRNGNLVESNSDAVLKAGKKLVFKPIQEGPLRKNPIMETGFDTNILLSPKNVFRIVTPFKDGSGYYEIGLVEELLYVDYEIMLIPLLKGRSIGNGGFFITAESSGQIMIPVHNHPKLLGKNIRDLGITRKHLSMPEYKIFPVIFAGQWYFCYKFTASTGVVTFAFLPAGEVYDSYLSQACITSLLLLALLFLAQITLKYVSKAWKKVESMQREKLKMVHKNLEMARNIQLDELRNDEIEEKNLKLASFIKPAEAVGGDFFDYFQLANGIKVNVIGDVSGEGIPAALFMMKAKTAIRENMRTASSLAEAVTAVNRYLCRHNSSLMFVTVWIGCLDLATGKVEYICAGHNPPLWTHKDREAEWLSGTKSPALGVSPKARFHSKEIQMEFGDGIFLYTDGVTEAKNKRGGQFSAERLQKLFTDNTNLHIHMVYKEILNFTDGEPQSDDITMLEAIYDYNEMEYAQTRKPELPFPNGRKILNNLFD